MKDRLKRTISIIICAVMIMSMMPASALAADTTESKTNTPFNYVALGDASTAGYGMAAKTGYGIAAKGTYPVLIRDAIAKNQFEVNLDQLAMGGMRVEELRFLLDDSYAGDPYLKEKFPDLANYREEYRTAISKANLVTYGLGAVDFGSALLYLFADPENNCSDPDVQALAAADADGIRASLKSALQSELNKLPSQLQDSAQSAADDMAGAYIDALVYGYYSFCMNYDRTLTLIKGMNPEADIIVLGLSNMLGNLTVGGSFSGISGSVAIGKIYNDQLIAKANVHMKSAIDAYAFIETENVEKFLNEAASYNGSYSSITQQMKNYCDIFEDDLLLGAELKKQLASYLSSKRTKGMNAAYNCAVKALQDTAMIESVSVDLSVKLSQVTNEDNRAEVIAQKKELYADMGKKILKALKDKIIQIAKSAANGSTTYESSFSRFIQNEMYCPIDVSGLEKKEALSVGRLIMAIGIRTQMGEGFFQQPSAKGHGQIKDEVLKAYSGKYLHFDTTMEPGCTTAGVKTEFWQNVVSGKCYSDAAYTTEVDKADQTIAPLGHIWGAWIVTTKPAFCKDGVKTSTCERCGDTKTAAINGLGPAKTKIMKKTGGKKAFTIKWKKPSAKNLKKTTGYQIRYSLKKSMKNSNSVLVTKNKTTTKTVKKLKARKKYFIQIRTYKLSKGKKYYSGWSSKVYVKTK